MPSPSSPTREWAAYEGCGTFEAKSLTILDIPP
jgi:hypothetical protein